MSGAGVCDHGRPDQGGAQTTASTGRGNFPHAALLRDAARIGGHALRVRNLDRGWGLRNVPVKGGKTRGIPLPAVVVQHLDRYVTQYLPTEVEEITPDTFFFWSTYGQRRQGLVRRPMEGKNIWRLCKTYGRLIDYPMLKPHDLRHGVAMEVYEQHHDLEKVRGLLGHTRLETTQLYAQIRPAALKHAVKFYEAQALRCAERLARK